jgi:hypothetical protein
MSIFKLPWVWGQRPRTQLLWQPGHKCCARSHFSHEVSDWVAARHIQREPQFGHFTPAKGMQMHGRETNPAIPLQMSLSLGVYVPTNIGIAMNSPAIGVPIIKRRIFHS